ncbi:MAG: MBL fold metallo-hydrolase, partial [Actinobacteria bacterium]|nr:MBL fold metallo-hydrolase [Actinomycetota bacterium]
MHPIELSNRVLDSGVVDEPVNRVTNELSELADGLAVVESFSHCAVWNSGDGLVCFDTSGAGSGRAVVSAIRGWSTEPFSHLVYTHGHVDHIGGSFAFAEDADTRGHAPANVVGHENVNVRIDRYTATNDWNIRINQRQFGGIRSEMGLNIGENLQKFLPSRTLRANQTFRDVLPMTIGDTKVEMHHARGETDDHLWAWLPDKKWLFAGDFVIWNY